MSYASVLEAGRARAQSRMLSTATVRRKTGQMVKSENGYESPEWVIVATDTPMRLGGTAANSAPYKTETPNTSEINYAARIAHFPASLSGLRNDDLIEVTAGENAGTVWRVIAAAWQDQSTARRLPCEQVERPSEWGES